MSAQLTLSHIDQHIDTLDRNEPSNAQTGWRSAYDVLDVALMKARRMRHLWAIPALICAAALAIAMHGLQWDWEDIRFFLLMEALALAAIWFVLSKLNPVLHRESRIAALLRYYGARDVPQEESIFR
jgi:hypothetical protein